MSSLQLGASSASVVYNCNSFYQWFANKPRTSACPEVPTGSFACSLQACSTPYLVLELWNAKPGQLGLCLLALSPSLSPPLSQSLSVSLCLSVSLSLSLSASLSPRSALALRIFGSATAGGQGHVPEADLEVVSSSQVQQARLWPQRRSRCRPFVGTPDNPVSLRCSVCVCPQRSWKKGNIWRKKP